jgi:hypothetical protein
LNLIKRSGKGVRTTVRILEIEPVCPCLLPYGVAFFKSGVLLNLQPCQEPRLQVFRETPGRNSSTRQTIDTMHTPAVLYDSVHQIKLDICCGDVGLIFSAKNSSSFGANPTLSAEMRH